MFPVSWSMFSSSPAMMFRSRVRSALPGMTSSTARHTVRHASGVTTLVPLASHGMLPAGDTVTVAPGMAALYALDMASRVTGLAACLIVALTHFSTSATGRRGREFPASLSGLAGGLSASGHHGWRIGGSETPRPPVRGSSRGACCRELHERGFVVLHRLVVPGAVLLVLAGFVLVVKVGVALLRGVVLATRARRPARAIRLRQSRRRNSS